MLLSRPSDRSAVELVKIVRETLEALFDLHLGIPEEVVAAAGEGLDGFLQRSARIPYQKTPITVWNTPCLHRLPYKADYTSQDFVAPCPASSFLPLLCKLEVIHSCPPVLKGGFFT